jgi:hypothetical protein
VPDRIKYIVANVKSLLRKRLRKKPGRPAEPKAAESAVEDKVTPATRAAA